MERRLAGERARDRGASGHEPPLVEGARAGVCAPDEGAFEGGEALLSPLSPNPNPNKNASSWRGVTSRFFFSGSGELRPGQGESTNPDGSLPAARFLFLLARHLEGGRVIILC